MILPENIFKKPVQFWNNIRRTDETKINLYQNDEKRNIWRREGTAHDQKYTTSSLKHGGSMVPLYVLMLQLIKAAEGILKCIGLHIFSAQVQLNALELIGWCFTVKIDNDLKHILMATQDFFLRHRIGIFCSGQVNHLTCILLTWRQRQNAPKLAGAEDSCSKGLADCHQGRNPASGDGVYGFYTLSISKYLGT